MRGKLGHKHMPRSMHLSAAATFSASSGASGTDSTVSEQHSRKLAAAPKTAGQAEFESAEPAAVHGSRTLFGFWVYLMTDCILFASLFAAYAVLHDNTFGGPSGKELFDMPFVLTETLILLTSSFTVGLGLIAARRQDKRGVFVWLGITFLLGTAFLGLEISEFTQLVQEGNSWERSGFLSAFFTLVGTHGLHITAGLIWMAIMMAQILRQGLEHETVKRVTMLGMFWHFLDVVWIFIFTIVYLMGVA